LKIKMHGGSDLLMLRNREVTKERKAKKGGKESWIRVS
jgi:hypothetical protein